MNLFNYEWLHTISQSKIRYKCGFCGTDTTPSFGWNTNESLGIKGYVLICSFCNKPSLIITRNNIIVEQSPISIFGNGVEGLPEDLELLYNEARSCTSSSAFTSAVLTCRKILMHIAVEKGAEEGLNFLSYVNFLSESNVIPADSKDWVDYIRKRGNEANHDIMIMSQKDARDLITFTEMLLRIVYEFPHRLISGSPKKPV